MTTPVHTPQSPFGASETWRPAEWNDYKITAILQFFQEKDGLPIHYDSEEAAIVEVFDMLTYSANHGQYSWPDFRAVGCSALQDLKLRWELAVDVFNALLKNEKIELETKVETEVRSEATSEDVEQSDDLDEIHHRDKRVRREATQSDSVERMLALFDNKELTTAMRILVRRSTTDVDFLADYRTALELADFVHDGLVAAWDGPQVEYNITPRALQRKWDLWVFDSPAKSKTSKTRGSPLLGCTKFELGR